MQLTDKHCVPCEGGARPLSISAENELLKETPGWEIVRLLEHKIRKVFTLKDFAEAIEFVNEVAKIAGREGHHPEMHINFRKVTVELYTHAILGLSENDFIMAAKIDEINI